MNRMIPCKPLSVVLSAGAIAATLAYGPMANAQVVVYPPAEYVASYEPIYYNGFAHYLYHDHWYYRDHGGAWRGYEHEPGALHDRRGEWARHGGGHHWR
jgi:hypothetical protein